MPVAIVFVLVFLQSLSELYLPKLMSKIVDTGVINGDTHYILKIGGVMLLVAAGGTICTVIASFLSAKIGTGLGRNLRNKVFTHVENFSLNEFNHFGTASLITRTTNDITQVQQVMIMILRMMIMAPMMCIGGIIMAVSTDAKLSLVIVVVMPILAFAIFLIAKKGIPLFRAMQVRLDKVNLVLRENLTGIRVIRAFNRVDYEKKRFNQANADLMNTAIQVNKTMAILMPFMMLMLNVTSIAIIWFGGIRIDHGNMQVGDLMAFIQYAAQIMFSLVMASMMFIMIPRASASAVRIMDVLDAKPEINDPEQEKMMDDHVRGVIEFRKVTFRYPGAERPAVQNISFKVNPGETTAIIGGTGSGKSTLLQLIPRFYDADEGEIIMNGVNIREMTQEHLRAKVGYVPQKAVLFTGTISENIRYGKEDATIEEIKHAAEIAQATEFISEMQDGFESVISQGGTNVSGGQKQRLSIARALVRKPEIYLLDDSFSALDFKTDAKLRAALQDEVKDSAVLIVAQRVSTVMNADRIIVLENGQIAGIGTHQDLLNTCDVYREIVFSQLSEEETAS